MRIVIDLQACQTAGSKNRGIGRYSMALAQAMVKSGKNHEFWIVLNGHYLETIEPIRAAFQGLVPQERIRVFHAITPAADIDSDNSWRRQVSERMREAFIADIQPDFVHVTSLFEGLVEDAVTSIGVFEKTVPHAITLYDLIPLLNQKPYLENKSVRDWYFRKLQSAKRCDLLLAISESTRQEGVDGLQFPQERVVNISSAIDDIFHPSGLDESAVISLRRRLGLRKDFLMYTGGIDYRKNIEGLIAAYAMLPNALRSKYQLAVVCSIHQSDRDRLGALCKKEGLADDEVVFTGFVSEDDLVALYNICTLFVFPSLHEGFGLPALEAMACGAATIGANNSSIPEVIGRDDALFDASTPRAIARKIVDVLQDNDFLLELRAHGPKQASRFSWERSAELALVAMEKAHESWSASASGVFAEIPRRRLAYVSPLPPEKTGIADYSAELLAELIRYYDIDVIADQADISDSWVSANLVVRSYDWFDRHAEQFDRIVYNFGNSHFHDQMFGLLERHPGVVVLHDFYLGHLQQWRHHFHHWPNYFPRKLFESHGYRALIDHGKDGESAAVWRYPANGEIFANSLGVIVHSKFAIDSVEQFYSNECTKDIERIHQLRLIPRGNRVKARALLGLDEDDFVVCSFGMIGPIKLNLRILKAYLASGLSGNRKCRLVFVGSNDAGEYGKELERCIDESGCSDRVIITGFLSVELFNAYLSGSDVAVQLRTMSRGETSRAVLDCMANALPVIVNAHGTMAEFPDDAVIKMPDQFSDRELSSALERLWGDKEECQRLRINALAQIQRCHAPMKVGAEFHSALEKLSFCSVKAREFRLLDAIAGLEAEPTSEDLSRVSTNMETNTKKIKQKELLIDISVLVQVDAKSGIQRVVRSIVSELLQNPPRGYRVEPVYSTQEGDWLGYRYARQYTLAMLGYADPSIMDEIVEPTVGDIFLGLDLVLHRVPRMIELDFFSHWRARGVKVYFVVYDLLPLLQSEHFEPGVVGAFGHWLDSIALAADGLICISKTVADELREWLRLSPIVRKRALGIGWFHLGADVEASIPSKGIPENGLSVLAELAKCPSVLMVGTIEPRKGQAQALAAFELLWRKGVKVNLVLVGKQGWLVDALAEKITNHPEHGRHLFWMHGVSDEYLEKIYESSDVLLAASEAEGFGLPLIEAARHGIPVIARDIPVFREVAGDHAFYFSGERAIDLADGLSAWLNCFEKNEAPQSKNMPWLTWAGSAQQLIKVLLEGASISEWAPDNVLRYRGSSSALRTQVGVCTGKVIRTTGKKGCLFYGPFISLSPGQYALNLYGIIRVPGVAKLDVCVDHGAMVLAEVNLSAASDGSDIALLDFPLVFTLANQCKGLEVRLWVNEESDMEISYFEIAPHLDCV